jgi:hypothetical protein
MKWNMAGGFGDQYGKALYMQDETGSVGTYKNEARISFGHMDPVGYDTDDSGFFEVRYGKLYLYDTDFILPASLPGTDPGTADQWSRMWNVYDPPTGAVAITLFNCIFDTQSTDGVGDHHAFDNPNAAAVIRFHGCTLLGPPGGFDISTNGNIVAAGCIGTGTSGGIRGSGSGTIFANPGLE